MHKLKYLLFLLPFLLMGCGKKADNRIVIWTNNAEFAQYVEVFNSTHGENSAVIVYKENPADSLPPAKDEKAPDIIISSYLNMEKPEQFFKPLNYLFDYGRISSYDFYTDLLETGHKAYTQYLLPVSFNLPLMIFSSENADLINENYMLSPENLRNISTAFNQKTKSGAFSKMGFTPSASEDFSYLATKLFRVNFHEDGNTIVWNDEKLQDTIRFLKSWTNTDNEGLATEEDFAYKYLFMPSYRQITSGRTLFSYTSSDQLFQYMKDDNTDINYRWIIRDGVIPIEDSYLMMGIYKDCSNQVGASEFITWFFDGESQRLILERKRSSDLDTEMFGIAGGFSAVRDVNEHILPLFYRQLLGNLPPSSMLSIPENLPAKWESYKESVIHPYLKESVKSSEKVDIQKYVTEWEKRILN